MAEFFNQWSTAEARIDYSLKKYYKYTKNEDPTRLVSNRFVLINIKMLDNKNGRFSKKSTACFDCTGCSVSTKFASLNNLHY